VNQAPKTANATFCATLCDQLWVNGLRAAFIAPGSRSTPLALALVEHHDIHVEIFHDERSAGFAALGHGLVTRTPALVLCSSGTAGAHFFAAVIEADASAVPMIVCTADRPPELWGRGAPQTIDQSALYGNKVRDFVEPGPPDDLDPSSWRPLANQLWAAATGPLPGPVHANLSFRDPLAGTPGELPVAIGAVEALDTEPPDSGLVDAVAADLVAKRGVLVVGRHESNSDDLVALAELLNWPIVCDHRSGCRTDAHAIQYFDAILREPSFADEHFPDVVLRVGEIVSSKSTSQWLARCGADVIASRPHGRNIDPEDIARLQFDERSFIAPLREAIADADSAACEPDWFAAWASADQRATEIVRAAQLDSSSEIAFTAQVVDQAPEGTHLVVSSSMPVRHVEWFAGAGDGITVVANRGANGIDGVLATAIGVALTGVPTACLIGDIALLHDSSSLIALREREVDLTIFVIDNDGGGIFSFLPQHELLGGEVFEQLFGTPHGTNITALAAAHGIPVTKWDAATTQIYPPAAQRAQIVLGRFDRVNSYEKHNELTAAVAAGVHQLKNS